MRSTLVLLLDYWISLQYGSVRKTRQKQSGESQAKRVGRVGAESANIIVHHLTSTHWVNRVTPEVVILGGILCTNSVWLFWLYCWFWWGQSVCGAPSRTPLAGPWWWPMVERRLLLLGMVEHHRLLLGMVEHRRLLLGMVERHRLLRGSRIIAT